MVNPKNRPRAIEAANRVLGGDVVLYAYVQGRCCSAAPGRRPLRGLAVTDRGVALFALSRWNTRPKRVVALGPREVLTRVASKRGAVQLDFGREKVRLHEHDYAQLTAVTAPVTPYVPHTEVARSSQPGPKRRSAVA